jgi:hypothetical protein
MALPKKADEAVVVGSVEANQQRNFQTSPLLTGRDFVNLPR